MDEGSTQGSGAGTVTRYYHNPITGNCEAFQYRGAGGNANNFESQEQCESYCKTCKEKKTVKGVLDALTPSGPIYAPCMHMTRRNLSRNPLVFTPYFYVVFYLSCGLKIS